MGLTRLMSAVRGRWPGLSTFRLVALTAVCAGVICAALEGPVFLTHLWALPGAPSEFALFDDDHRFPYAEYLTTTMVFTSLGVLRFFRNDKGESLVEHGLDRLPRTRRTITSAFATIAYMNLALIALILVQVPTGMHAAPYPNYPAHLVNGLCDAGPFTGTPYGPCPGSPGFASRCGAARTRRTRQRPARCDAAQPASTGSARTAGASVAWRLTPTCMR
jgi:hypothetical protein